MTARCKSCNAEIIWTRTESGKAMPVDAEPSPDGNLYLVVGTLGPRAIAVSKQRTFFDDVPNARYTSHFATCPDAQTHRKPRP